MENKQDRKLASLKKDPDEDVGSNHDRKPASLQKDNTHVRKLTMTITHDNNII
jgi:hypothetical protein